MHRFYVDHPVEFIGQEILLSQEESEHASRVLRLKAGEEIQLLDGENRYNAVLMDVSEHVTAKVTELCPSPEAPCKAYLMQGLPKADKLEMIVQKATELGAWEIWPVEMLRSVAKADKGMKNLRKRERLQRIAMEAAKQSGRAHVPAVSATLTMKEAYQRIREQEFDMILVAWEEEHALALSKAVGEYCQTYPLPAKVLIVIGPEGGIDPEEKQRLDQLGARSVTLGPRILRTETAGLCALSVLWAAVGEM